MRFIFFNFLLDSDLSLVKVMFHKRKEKKRDGEPFARCVQSTLYRKLTLYISSNVEIRTVRPNVAGERYVPLNELFFCSFFCFSLSFVFCVRVCACVCVRTTLVFRRNCHLVKATSKYLCAARVTLFRFSFPPVFPFFLSFLFVQ